MKVRWLKAATVSLRMIHRWIATENPQAAKRVAARIESAVDGLATFPNSGRVGKIPGTRELVIPGLPYLAVYRIGETEVEILRVFHTAQDWLPLMH